MKIFLNGKRCKADTLARVVRLVEILAESGHEVVLDGSYFGKLPIDGATSLPIANVGYKPVAHADLAISIGGDGTFLRTSKKVAHLGVPIAGINSGRLGFLAAADLSDMEAFIAEINEGRYVVETHTMLEARREDGVGIDMPLALNEVAFLRHDTSSVISVDVEVDGTPLTTYKADGLIISTPTGSTAYNLSCGGPIIAPTAANLVLTPVSPHSLNMRPLVLPDSAVLRVLLNTRAEKFQLSLDGNTVFMPNNGAVIISKSACVARVVQRLGHSFAQSLHDKLLWGKDMR